MRLMEFIPALRAALSNFLGGSELAPNVKPRPTNVPESTISHPLVASLTKVVSKAHEYCLSHFLRDLKASNSEVIENLSELKRAGQELLLVAGAAAAFSDKSAPQSSGATETYLDPVYSIKGIVSEIVKHSCPLELDKYAERVHTELHSSVQRYEVALSRCLANHSSQLTERPLEITIERPFLPVASAGLRILSGVISGAIDERAIDSFLPLIAENLDIVSVPNLEMVFCRVGGKFKGVKAEEFLEALQSLPQIVSPEKEIAARTLDAMSCKSSIWSIRTSEKAHKVCDEFRATALAEKERILRFLSSRSKQDELKLNPHPLNITADQSQFTTSHLTGQEALRIEGLTSELSLLARNFEYRPSDTRIAFHGGTVTSKDDEYFRGELSRGLCLAVTRDRSGALIGFALYTPCEREDLLAEDVRLRYSTIGMTTYLNFIVSTPDHPSVYPALLFRIELESPNSEIIVGRVIHSNQRALMVHSAHGEGIVYSGDIKLVRSNIPLRGPDEPLVTIAQRYYAEDPHWENSLQHKAATNDTTALGVLRPTRRSLRDVASRIGPSHRESKVLSRYLLNRALVGIFEVSNLDLMLAYSWQSNREYLEWEILDALTKDAGRLKIGANCGPTAREWMIPLSTALGTSSRNGEAELQDTSQAETYIRIPGLRVLEDIRINRYFWRGDAIGYFERHLHLKRNPDKGYDANAIDKGEMEAGLDAPSYRVYVLNTIGHLGNKRDRLNILSKAPGAF